MFLCAYILNLRYFRRSEKAQAALRLSFGHQDADSYAMCECRNIHSLDLCFVIVLVRGKSVKRPLGRHV